MQSSRTSKSNHIKFHENVNIFCLLSSVLKTNYTLYYCNDYVYLTSLSALSICKENVHGAVLCEAKRLPMTK